MGLFNFIKKKKEQPQKTINAEEMQTDETKKVILDTREDRSSYIRDNCEMVIDATKQIEDAKIEYQAVTSYLSDMQKIDLIPVVDQREKLDDAARKIITFQRERSKYQNSDNKMKETQYKNMEKYDDIIPDEIKKIGDNERYQSVIKDDMAHLEGEKGSLHVQQGEVLAKQKYLKGLAMVTSILVALLFLLFIAIAYAFEIDMIIPYILTIIMATLSAIYIFFEARKNRYDIILINRKQNKAIRLLNRVKIKYINTTNDLDYAYNKFSIHSAMELEYLWNQYLKAKEEEKKYKKNTEMLNLYNETLIEELKKFGIIDADIWIYQSVAIIDSKEMVEVRHRLNVRRQKLRERIDYNTKLKENSINEIKQLLKRKPELKAEVIEILSEYNINL